MAKQVQIGEMRTRITIRKLSATSVDNDGYQSRTYTDVFSGPVWCKWVWEHGQEAMENMRLDLQQTAVITMWYDSAVDERCVVYHEDETDPWEVVRINNAEDRNRFMEITVRRRDKA